MPPDELNVYRAIDLTCDECKWIIATLHEGARLEP